MHIVVRVLSNLDWVVRWNGSRRPAKLNCCVEEAVGRLAISERASASSITHFALVERSRLGGP
jgi:hypothetical protein